MVDHGSINRVVLVGEIVAAPELTTTETGKTRATLFVETVLRWIDQVTGQRQQESERHRVVLWGKLAATAGRLLRTGAEIYLEGRVLPRYWTDESGVEHRSVSIRGNTFRILGAAP